MQRFPPTIRPCSQTLDTRAVLHSFRKQQNLRDHSGLGARKCERASRGMALYSVRADWWARIGRHTSGASGTGGVGLAGNGVGLEGERGRTEGEWGRTGGNGVGLGGNGVRLGGDGVGLGA